MKLFIGAGLMGSLMCGALLAQPSGTITSLQITGCSSGCTVQFGHTVSLSATVVRSGNGSPVTSGAVAFYDGTSLIGVSGPPNSSGVVPVISSGLLPVGLNSITARYETNNSFTTSASSSIPVTIQSVTGSGFSPAYTFPSGLGPSAVAMGDFNNDGNVDFAVANTTSSTVIVFMGNGSGGFTADPDGPFPVSSNPIAIAVGDFNGDGKLDIATANNNSGSGTSNISVLINSGNLSATTATFNTVVNYSTGSGTASASAIAVGDINGDGVPDLAVANKQVSGTVSVLLGSITSPGTFGTATIYAVGSLPSAIAIADFNSDGKTDFATANSGSGNISVLINQGGGAFSGLPSNPYSPDSGTSTPSALTVADFNGDGIPDIAVANTGSSNVSVLLGMAGGGFSLLSGGPFAVGGSPTGIATGDFNGDGLIDIVTVDNGASGATGVSVIRGVSGGGFGTSSQYSTTTANMTDKPYALAVADFNGDGIADIVTADPGSGSGFHMSVLLGLVPTVTTITSVSPSPGTFGSNATITGTVGPGVSAGDTVSFYSGATLIGSFAFVGGETPGTFAFNTASIPQGTVYLTANYNGGSTYATSTTLSSTAYSNLANSTTTLTASPNPSVAGQSVLLTAAVTPGATGTVYFYDYEIFLGIGTLNQSSPNQATLQTSLFSTVPNANSVTAQYQGDGNYNPSTSSAVNQVVLNATTVTLTSSVNPSSAGQQTTLTANVTSAGAGTITGTLSFYQNGSSLLGSVTLPANSIAYAFSSPGSIPVTAVYTPDSGSSGTFASSTSNTVTQNVLTATNTSLTGISPAAPVFGQNVTLHAMLSPVAGSAPYGKITFLDGATVLGTVPVASDGTATFSTPLLSQGLRALRARGEINPAPGLGPSTSTVSQVTVSSAAQSGFSAATTYTVGPSTYAVAVGDFNGDGIDDIAVVTVSDSFGVEVLLGTGTGAFGTAHYYPTASPPVNIRVGDFNGDGAMDLIMATDAGIEVLLNTNTGQGLFASSTTVTATGTSGISIAVADVNGDGIPDAVVGTNGNIVVYPGLGGGTFGTATSTVATANATFVTVADFNNDGKADIAAVDTSGYLYILIGNGDGTFQTPVLNVTKFRPTTSSLYSIATGDFNGDGYTDLVMGGIPSSGPSTAVFLYPGGEEGFTSSTLITTTGVSYSVAIGDFNGDGKADIAVTDVGTADVEILTGHGDLTFATSVSYPIANFGYNLAVGNFTSGSGRGDLVVGYGTTQDIGVLLSLAGGPTVSCVSQSPTVIVGSAFSLSCPASGGVSPYTYTFGMGSTLTPASPAFAVSSAGLVTGTPTATGQYVFTVQATDSSSPTPLVGVSSQVTLTVNAKTATTTTLSLYSGSNPTTLGQSVTLQAVVSPTPAGGVVVFYDGANGIGSSNLYSGVAQFPTANLALGSHSITAVYNGDTNDAGSTSSPVVEVVNPAPVPISFNYVSLVDGSSPLQSLGYFRLEGLAGTSEVNGYTFSATAATVASGAPLDISGNHALQFNGSTSAVTTSLSGGIGGAGTIMAWVNLSVLPSTLNAFEYIAGESQVGNDFDLQFTAANTLGFYTTNSGQSISWTPPAGSLLGTWHHVVATFDNDDGSAVRALYWDGQLVARDTTTSLTNKTTNFQIGASSTFPGRNFDGLIDEVAVFNYALTPLQVAQIYYAPLSILPNGNASQTYGPLTMSAAGGSGNYTWSATGLPTGMALSSTGLLNGSPAVSGIFSPVITATDTISSQTASLSYTLTVGPVPSTLSLSVYPNPATPGQLVTLNATVSPAAAGTATPTGTVQFFDGTNLLTTAALPGYGSPTSQATTTSFALGQHTLTAYYSGDTNFLSSGAGVVIETISNQPPPPVTPPLTIQTTSLPSGLVGQSYSAGLSASGGSGAYTWSSGTLPAGLSLNPAGALSGTPTAAFSGAVLFKVTDPGGDTATTFLGLSITTGPLSISGSGNLGDIATGTAVAASYSAGGGSPPYTWKLSGISGLVVDSAGNVRGSVTPPGSYAGTLTLTDSASNSTALALSLTVLGLTGNFPAGTTTTTYNGSAAGVGGVAPYTYAASGIPQGLSFSGGTLSGTATAAGTYTIGITVTDAAKVSFYQTFTFKITGPAPASLTITTTSLPDAFAGQFYSESLSATGGTPGYTWAQSGGQMPKGMSLSPAGNLIGTPTTVQSWVIGVQATDSKGAIVVGSVSINTQPAPLVITSASPFPAGQVGVDYPSQILTASGGTAPYTFSVTGTLPNGLSLVGGQIGGTPVAPGNGGFNLVVTDSAAPPSTASLPVTLTIGPNTPNLVLSSAAASFAVTTGTTAAPPPITVAAASSVVTDVLTYTSATSVPWLTVGGSTNTPGSITIGLNNAALSLGAGSSPYSGTVTVTCTSPVCSGKAQTVTVTLTVTSPPPQLTLGSPLLSFVSQEPNPQSSSTSLALINAGGGSLAIQSVVAADAWISVGTFPASVAPGPGGSVTITANPAGLQAGYYSSSVTVNSAAGSLTIPVTFLIASAPVMTLGPAGTQFSMPQNGVLGNSSGSFAVSVSSGSVSFSAAVLSGASWLTLSGGASGTASLGSPGNVSFSVNQAAAAVLTAGAYYGTIRITATGSVNSPQDFQVVLEISQATSRIIPNPQPAGLLFIGTGGALPSQTVQLFASSKSAIAYQSSASVNSGSGWLKVNPQTGTTSAAAPAQISVSVSTAGLTTGIYTGTVSFAFGTVVQSVNVTLIVTTSTLGRSTSDISDARPTTTGPTCAGAQLVPTQTGLVSNFSAPASWPTPLAILLVDSCGSAVAGGQVVTTFSNGDPPLILAPTNPSAGLYSGTWTPRKTSQQVTILARATAPGYSTATTQIAGQVAPNTAPVLAPNGTFDIFNPLVGAGLGPGNIVQIYGSGLAGQIGSPSTLPLPTSLNNTTVLIGGIPAPLFYVSPGQINAQVPFELTAGNQYQLIVNANGALTTPQPLQLTTAVPAILQYNSGDVVAQHQDGSDITDNSPAVPGEYVSFYLSGLGDTDIPVPSGTASPTNPLAHVLNQPTLTVNGNTVPILFAGLAPGFVGVYQINFQVPSPLPDGNYPLIISQSGVSSNQTILPVRNPAQN